MTTKPQHVQHPGEILANYMTPRGMSAQALADSIGVPGNRISDIIRGRRGISADTAIRLSRVFDTSPKTWLAWQADYDLWEAEHLSRRL
jgi:addiction module HigA family antidote